MTTPKGMKESINEFAKQFAWEPKVLRARKLKKFERARPLRIAKRVERVVVCGMGGSHLAADLLAQIRPDLRMSVWSDYGLLHIPKSEAKTTLVIASSYSGNTEETISAFRAAGNMGLRRAVIAAGGKLIELAEREGVPAVVMPDWGLQPRAALGLNIKGLVALLGSVGILRELSALSRMLEPKRFELQGKALAKTLHGKVPVIYASQRNYAIAYNWKIKFNETGKIPAFYNILPELNHNEMTGFDATPKSKKLSYLFHVLFLVDPYDHPRVIKRMRITSRLYRKQGIPVTELPLKGTNPFLKIFSSLILADWAAYYTARFYGADPTAVPMVEEFKALISRKK